MPQNLCIGDGHCRLSVDGRTTTHALGQIEARGTLFVESGMEVYEGMIVGEHSRDSDLVVNPVREKKLTNVRNQGSEERTILVPPRYCIFCLQSTGITGTGRKFPLDDYQLHS